MIKLSNLTIAFVTVAGMASLAAAGGDTKAGAVAPKMEMPKPPQELADMAKNMSGTWKCSGQALGDDMKTMGPLTGTAKLGLELGGYWMHNTYDAKMGKMPFHFEEYTTFDQAAKTWRRVMVEMGGSSTGTSSGPNNNKMDWELATQNLMGVGMFRDHEDWSDMKVGFKSWGEMSSDKGKTWTKVYEQTCKK